MSNEEEDYIARSLRNQGKRGMDFGGLHTDFGNSMRITEMNALLGRIHLAKLPEMLKKRERAYELITEKLWFKVSPFKGIINKNCPLNQSSSFQGEVILNSRILNSKFLNAPLKEAGLSFVSTEKMDIASNYKLIVHLPEGKNAKEVKTAMTEEEIFLGGTVYEIPCHKQPVFAGICEGESFPRAERWCPNHICPPLTSGMTDTDAQRVGEALVRYLK
ncbi:DegT/DnrJ/EryC1/StrS family aminotransferase [Okeania sp. SIO2C9]|uniref:DegT/DnrJ/EryC1/StrS family aminotransferase n=1 Tax=Okeania sp. SIO2C9 TaxID=2607791 RepID=UPI0025E432A5|nr:DegT/DnrJ/EryC1/StrS family aminotransferase [Okeania sp. SIO2C9]